MDESLMRRMECEMGSKATLRSIRVRMESKPESAAFVVLYHRLLLKTKAFLKSWMTSNVLLLNSDKSGVIVFGPKHFRVRLDHIITL